MCKLLKFPPTSSLTRLILCPFFFPDKVFTAPVFHIYIFYQKNEETNKYTYIAGVEGHKKAESWAYCYKAETCIKGILIICSSIG